MMHRWKRPTPGRLARMALHALAASIGLIGVIANTAVAVGLAVAFTMLACLAALVVTDRDGKHHGGLSRLARFVAAALALAPVVAGLIVLVGAVSWPIVLLCGIAAAWHGLRRRRRATPEPDPDYLLGLSDAELGQAWRHSHTRLRSVHDAGQLDRLCTLRRRQLDEMERRYPRGFHRWLRNGSWVSGSAAPFLEN